MQNRIDYALHYADRGWHVVPLFSLDEQGACCCGNAQCISPGKHPDYHLAPKGLNDASINPEKLKLWFSQKPNANIGVVTGRQSGFFVVDVDKSETKHGDETLEKLESTYGALPDTVRALTANGGFHYLFQYPDNVEKIISATNTLGPWVDTRGDGGYIVVEPSTLGHRQWAWEADNDPIEDGVSPAPAPVWMIELIRRKNNPAKAETTHSGRLTEPDLIRIRDALSCIPSEDRTTWLTIGMSLQSTNSEQAYDLWNDWSKLTTAGNHNEDDQFRVWQSFKNTGLHLESLFWIARQHGWAGDVEIPQVEINLQSKDDTEPDPLESGEFPDILYSPPGILATVADYMNLTSRKLQPAFSVAAAISLCATVLGRRYATSTGLRTNIYQVILGRTSTGKEHARQAMAKILTQANLADSIGGDEIKSASGLSTAVERNPNILFRIDEFGQFLKSVQGKNSQAFQTEILTTFMKLFSQAQGIYYGSEYANQKDRPRTVIEHPCVNLYASSTPSEFYSALNSSHAFSGYLNRLICIESPLSRPVSQKPARSDIPQPIFDWIHYWRNESGLKGNMEGFLPGQPIVIEYSREAWDYADQLEAEINDLVYNNEEEIAALWGRAWEHIMKLALVLACSDSMNMGSTFITVEQIKWARVYVFYSIKNLIKQSNERIADSQWQSQTLAGYRAIKERGEKGMTSREMHRHRAFSALQLRQRDEVLNTLKAEGKIVFASIKTRGRSRDAWVSTEFAPPIYDESTF